MQPGPGTPTLQSKSKKKTAKVLVKALSSSGEVTGQQNRFAYGMPFLFNPAAAAYDTYRAMRKHPTIAMVRMLSVAPVIAANWSIESSEDAPEGADELIREQLLPLRPLILEECMLHGLIDFGWSAFEKVFEQDSQGQIALRRLKPLLPDITTIMIGMKGEFAGVRQTGPLAHIVDLDVEKCLLCSYAVEGSNWYGNPRMENVRLAYNKWMECDVGAARYDKKIAGSHWVIYYPPGYTGEGDDRKDNYDIAMGILASIEASGSMVLPSTTIAFLDELNQSTDAKRAWEVEFLQDSGGKQLSFVNRLRYLDSLIARGLITPERSVTEGQMGTKAEAGIHSDAAATAMDLEHQHTARLVNWHLVNQLLRLNYGPDAENSVWIVPAPMDDTSIAFLRTLYQGFLTNPQLATDEYPNIDRDALRERIGVPALEVEEREEKNELDIEPTEAILPQMLRGIIASDEPRNAVELLLPALRALQDLHHDHHLRAQGEGFWGRHKLLGSAYETLEDEYDAVAEALVSSGGELPRETGIKAVELVSRWSSTGGTLLEKSLAAELDFRSMLKAASEACSDEGLRTVLGDVAKAHGITVYLMKQACAEYVLAHPDVPLDSVEHDPSDAKKAAGNYKKGHIRLYGLDVTIENPKLSVRRGKDWAVPMRHHYGYFRRTKGMDGDHVDCVIGPDVEQATHAYVIRIPDEEKYMLGFTDAVAARHAFDDMYQPGVGAKLFRGLTEVPIAELRGRLAATSFAAAFTDNNTDTGLRSQQTDNDSTTAYKPSIVRVKGNKDDHVAYGMVGDMHHLVSHAGTGKRSIVSADSIEHLRDATADEVRKAGIGNIPSSKPSDNKSLTKDIRRYGGGTGDYPAGAWGDDDRSYREAALRDLGIGLSEERMRVEHMDPNDIDIKGGAKGRKKKVKRLMKQYKEDPEAVGPPKLERKGDKTKITDGRHRVKAARKAGLKSIPVVVETT